MVTKTEDVTNSSITVYQYDQYGNVIKTTTEVTKDGETTVTLSESTYDILGRVTSTKSGDSETVYTYDAEGRTLLVNADGMYRRTVYDSRGRTVQEIEDADYSPELDNLPDAYGDTTVGQRYFYDEYGNMYKEINRHGLQTDYYYSDDGLLFIKSFDIYDYYYNNKGSIEHVDVNGYTTVSYEYNISDKNIKVGSGQSLNSITYADGYKERQLVDKSGNVLAKYRNNESQPYYYICDAGKSSVKYNNTEKGVHGTSTIVTSNDDGIVLQSQPNELSNNPNLYYQYYHQTKTDDAVNTSQIDFLVDFRRYETVKDDSIVYSSDETPQYTCYYTNDETATGQAVKKDDLTIFNSDITYDEANDSFVKSYSRLVDADVESLASFSYVYDENGNISSDESNSYTYDEYGELINVSGEHNSSYTYDSRGNMTSKTVDGETTEFSYDNMWWDQLVSVNGEPLTYDANGNLTSYGERSYEWSNGKQLSQITDGENTYSYSYDENGIRWKKKVNGTDIRINTVGGRVTAQRTGLTSMFFQYDRNGTPFGFIYEKKQYFYITNLSGDVVGITDADGNKIAEYTYDEWGKLLDITATDMSLAKLNPLRYRGYYYDNETGYYYLQSRYYDPELGRFISSDGFEYIDTSNRLNSNAYIYCWNCPTAFEDADGTTPKLSIDKQTITDFLSKTAEKIKNNNIVTRFQNLQSEFNASMEKLKFYYMNPGELTSELLTNLLGKEVHIEFKLLKEIRSRIVSAFQTIKQGIDNIKNKNDNEEEGIAPFYIINDEPTDNWFEAALKGLILSIELDSVTRFFEELIQAFYPAFNLNNWYEKSARSVQYYFEDLFMCGVTALNTLFSYAFDRFGEVVFKSGANLTAGKIIEKLLGEQISSMIDVFFFFKSGAENFENHSIDYSMIATFADFGVLILSIMFPYLTIPFDAFNDLFKAIMTNIDYGNIWG